MTVLVTIVEALVKTIVETIVVTIVETTAKIIVVTKVDTIVESAVVKVRIVLNNNKVMKIVMKTVRYLCSPREN